MQAPIYQPDLGQTLNLVILHAEVILTFIFMNSRMAPALDSQLSGGRSKLMREGSHCQHIRKKPFLSKRRCEFQVLVTYTKGRHRDREEVVSVTFTLEIQTEGRNCYPTSNLEPS